MCKLIYYRMHCGHSADDWRDLHYDDRGDAYLDKCEEFERFEMSPDLEQRCGFCVAMEEDTLDTWADELEDAVLIEDPAGLALEALKMTEGGPGSEEEEPEAKGKGKGKARATTRSSGPMHQSVGQEDTDSGKGKGKGKSKAEPVSASSSSRPSQNTRSKAASQFPKPKHGDTSSSSPLGSSAEDDVIGRKAESKVKGKGKGKEKPEVGKSPKHRR